MGQLIPPQNHTLTSSCHTASMCSRESVAKSNNTIPCAQAATSPNFVRFSMAWPQHAEAPSMA
eukprot:5143550-Amphidinium_carterae.1